MEEVKNKFEKDMSTGLTRIYVNSRYLQENIDFINENKIGHVVINTYQAKYDLDNCEFLKETPNVFKLDVVNSDIDLNGILYLPKLSELYLNVDRKQKIDCSNLTLTEINFQFFDGIKGLEACHKLKKIIVRKANESFLNISIFQNFTLLEHLELVQCNLPKTLDFLNKNINLKHIEIHYCKMLLDLLALSNHAKNLEILKIGNCKKVENIEVISKLVSLTWFSLTDSIPLKDSNIVKFLPNLKILVVLGSSFFENGDLRGLQEKLEHLGIDNKRHYIL